jgi:putative DNA primase/helicase
MPKIIRTPRVSGKELEDLRAGSGLKDETISAAKIYTENDGAKLAKLLNRKHVDFLRFGGTVFPYHTLTGEVNYYACVRPHQPRINKNGGPKKYEVPLGESCRAYYPPGSLAKLLDGKSDVYITEGQKKALALSQLGFAAVGIAGAWNWKKPKTDFLIDGLLDVTWMGRNVYVVFDFDEKEKARWHVDLSRRRLAKALREAGAKEVFSVALSPGPGGAKQGVDDFLVANGENAFEELVKKAEPVPVGTSMDQPEGKTDAANAARLVAKFREVIRWVGPWDKWLIWDGKRWKVDQELRIQSFAKETAADLWREIADASANKLDSELIKRMIPWATYSNQARGIGAMVSLAKSEPDVPIGIEDLDTDPWLLNLENGTLDLRAGELREHRQDDFITKLSPVRFDPDAVCPMWLKFLGKIFSGDKDLIGYVQRLVGHSITGVTREHLLIFLFGDGANGKSTFCEILLKLLGLDYGMKAAPDLLMAKRGESHPTDRADLFGKRLVACIETEEGRRLNESLAKELTGGDRIRARRMREDFWEFTPTHHVWMAGNHKPAITGTDHGIWRRVKLIPFDVVIHESEQDKELPAKLASEVPGILNWAIAGCLDWQRDGMQEPDIVQVRTTAYASEMDEVEQFLTEHCQIGAEYLAPATELFQMFQQVTGNKMSQTAFGRRLRAKEFESKRTPQAVMGWKGLRLLKDVVPAAIADGFKAAHPSEKAGK